MKRLMLLFLLPSLLFGQRLLQIKPVISTTEIDSITTVTASATVIVKTASVTRFTSVTAGMRCEGNSIPWGTTVVSKTGDSLLVLSNKATASVALDSIRFGYFTSLAYSDGDALGFPFDIGPVKQIDNIFVTDDADQMTSLELVFFSTTFAESEDNMAFSPVDADADNVFCYRVLGITQDWGPNKIVTMDDTELPLYMPQTNQIIVQMVSTGAWTFSAVNNITINLVVE